MPKITFASNDQSFEVPAGTSMLEFCQSNDAPVNFGCTVGACGTCVNVISCEDDAVNAMDEDEKDTLENVTDAAGARLCCQLTVNGDVTVSPAS